jgi:hypothetical protein
MEVKMTLKASIKYILKNSFRSIIIYYFVILCVICLAVVSALTPGMNGMVKISGTEMATVIFLFIFGLNSFKDEFQMFIQNGLSRKTLFLGEVLSILAISIGMAIIDLVIFILSKFILVGIKNFELLNLFQMTYSKHTAGLSTLNIYAESLIFQIGLYLAAALIGYFITIGYYRMNKAAKTAVSISVPVGCFVILPMIDSSFTNGTITRFIGNIIIYALGIQYGKPSHALVTFLLLAIVSSGFCWLMMRRAIVKNN